MRNDVQTSQPASPRSPARQDGDPARYSDATLTPPVDVIEDASGITLYADLPGVSREKLNLQVESDTLTIEAESGHGARFNNMLGEFRIVEIPAD